MAIELVDFETLKSLLHLEKTESDYPALNVIRESVLAAFEEYIGRYLTEEKYSELVNVIYPTKMIPLKALPIKSITSVDIDGSITTDFKLTSYGIELGFKTSSSTVTVFYTGGLPEVPTGLARAALLQTAYEFQSHDNIGAKVVSTEGGSVTLPELGLLKVVKGILKNYRHPLNRML